MKHVYGEIPYGIIDGRNRLFILKKLQVPNSLVVYLNGLNEKKSHHYRCDIRVIELPGMFIMPDPPLPGDAVYCDYETF